MAKLKNIHPGEILLEEFLRPMEISQTRLANSIGVPPRRINEIVLGKRGITADTALRLGQGVRHFRAILDGLARRIRIARSPQRNREATRTHDADCGIDRRGKQIDSGTWCLNTHPGSLHLRSANSRVGRSRHLSMQTANCSPCGLQPGYACAPHRLPSSG